MKLTTKKEKKISEQVSECVEESYAPFSDPKPCERSEPANLLSPDIKVETKVKLEEPNVLKF